MVGGLAEKFLLVGGITRVTEREMRCNVNQETKLSFIGTSYSSLVSCLGIPCSRCLLMQVGSLVLAEAAKRPRTTSIHMAKSVHSGYGICKINP